MTLYCATKNPGKLREFQAAAGDIAILPLPGLNTIPAPEETGATFTDNAILKARYYSRFAPGLLFADDSGLVVDALGGEPGVYSARYAGAHATDAQNNALLLERLRGVANRAARFVCVIALAHAGQLITTFEGVVHGHIIDTPRGANGFGYDPIFFYPPLNRTIAEIDTADKFHISHRGAALSQLFAFLRQHPADTTHTAPPT
jgi:XTP/dITP diphosphohydrolase